MLSISSSWSFSQLLCKVKSPESLGSDLIAVAALTAVTMKEVGEKRKLVFIVL